MADFAKAEFALSAKQSDGSTLKDHLISAWRQSGIEPEELKNKPKCPQEAGPVWAKFLQLHKARHVGGFSAGPITFPDIQAWQTVTRSRLEPWELRAILRLDGVYMAHAAASAKPGA